MGDADIQNQRHRVRGVGKVGRLLNIPTMPTPTFSYLLRFHCMCCAEKVSQLFNRPVECRCDERLKTKAEESTRLAYTGLLVELEHLKIKTTLIDEMFASVMGEYVFLK